MAEARAGDIELGKRYGGCGRGDSDKMRVEVADAASKKAAQQLKDAGYDVVERDGENSGLHAILVTSDGLEGGAAPRREGVVRRPTTSP